MKNKLILLVLFGILLFSSMSFIAGEEQACTVDVGEEEIGIYPGLICGKGIEYMRIENNILAIEFSEVGAFLKIRENRFENIVPSKQKLAFVALDEFGENLIGAAFTTTEKGGEYVFTEGEDPTPVPPNSKVLLSVENLL